MGTKKLGKGTSNVSVNMPAELAEELRDLAKQSGQSFSAYAKRVLEEAARKNVRYETVRTEDLQAAEEPSDYGTKKGARRPSKSDTIPHRGESA